MVSISKHAYTVSGIDALIITFISLFSFSGYVVSLSKLIAVTVWFLFIIMFVLYSKNLYETEKFKIKDFYYIFEGVAVGTAIAALPVVILKFSITSIVLPAINGFLIFAALILFRILLFVCTKLFKKQKNVLIVGAGQDGKLIAEEIQTRPELNLKVTGFLDDNMNTIEDEDSTIPILGLTCDSEAVIKDNNVDIVIIAVKSRMDSAILSDLVRGIPLGVKVWRMPKFYEKITSKYFVSKMTVNWLFYSCVRKKALFYAYIKRFCDIISSILILLITSPISLIAALGIKFSDFGPVFFTQIRIGKFGKPFKMIKFRTMYQDSVEDDFDDDLNEVFADDKRIMPFCKILRKFHIDELPQMINVLRGEMSIVGPRPVREEVYYDNKERVPFWECRNWVRPGWCGWQQVNVCDPVAEERLAYDLYYIKHRHIIWEFLIVIHYFAKVLCGRCK